MSKQAKYKPLLFTTTLRNPERLKHFLSVLKDYDGEILDDRLAKKICGEIIKRCLYKPLNLSKTVKEKYKKREELTERETAVVLRNNPQKHKEAGFSKGWSSRFDTFFKIAKEFGFVFYKNGERIKFSDIGLKLVNNDGLEFEQQAFLNSLAKYQNSNPFRRVLNDNVPLVLLLQVISKLNIDNDYNNTGISKLELPLLIYWKDNDSEKLYQRIKKLRNDFGYSPSWEVVIAICRDEIMEGKDIKRNNKSIMVDYPDEFIRKMRLTGLISLRGFGQFIDVNKNEEKKINYVLKKYSAYKKYESDESYFNYISSIDEKLVFPKSKHIPIAERESFLIRWADHYGLDVLEKEMLILSKRNILTKDEILKYLSNPVRLEFLTALIIKARFPNIQVFPNYPIDDEGLPTSTAGGAGNKGDIECFEDENGILVEVTMSGGSVQTKMEGWPTGRHLEEFNKKRKNSICYFIAPSLFSDSIKQFEYLKEKEGLLIFPKTIKEFLTHLKKSNTLYIDKNY